jgi:hypothetical protein
MNYRYNELDIQSSAIEEALSALTTSPQYVGDGLICQLTFSLV